MNYYEHHIGDYDSATAHLSLIEDAVYRRLICLYYRTEQPLPTDTKAVCRLVRAVAKAERDAVQQVLSEFFEQQDDGWHNGRCDQEIARYTDGEPEREVKKANEANRLKRHREERARLFKVLTDAGQHAPWNVGMNELRELVKRIGPPLPATAPATPATATQAPDTNTQPPEEESRGRATALPPTWILPDEWAEWCRQTRPDLDPKLTAERFRDFWVAKPGKDGRKLDWLATWRNWVRNERPGPRASLAQAEPAWRTEQRNRIREAAPYAVTQPPTFDEESWSQPHELPAP